MRTFIEWAGFALIVLGLALWLLPVALVVAGVLLVLEANFGTALTEEDDGDAPS